MPAETFQNLALSLSGGGYRAAAFHLGLLTYLSSAQWKDKSLLERVRILSTVSGGTFTGVCYATTIAGDKPIEECYAGLYRLMTGVDLIEEGLARLSEFKSWNSPKGRNLINAFSLINYDRFEKNTFSFLFDHPTHLKEIIFNFPVGLMDGGIVDNQGIDSVFWAEQRMQEYKGNRAQFASQDVKAIDLCMISDVSSPFMDSYVKTEEKPMRKWRKWSFRTFLKAGLVFLAAGALNVYLACILEKHIWTFITGFFASLLFLMSALSFFLSNIFTWLLKKCSIPDFFMKRLGRFTRLKFGVYETLIMNAIYELTPQQTSYRNENDDDRLSADLKNPTQRLMEAAEKAKSMGTTLWFTPDELDDDPLGERSMLNALIACVQFTGCFNLLAYMEKELWCKENKEAYDKYPQSLKTEIKEFYDTLMSDWHRFNDKPYWMVDVYHQKIKP